MIDNKRKKVEHIERGGDSEKKNKQNKQKKKKETKFFYAVGRRKKLRSYDARIGFKIVVSNLSRESGGQCVTIEKKKKKKLRRNYATVITVWNIKKK